MANNRYFDIISEIEAATAPLDEIVSTLLLFEEQLSRDSAVLNPAQPYTVDLFKNRLDMIMAMLRMIERELGRVNNSISEQINNAYRIYREEKHQSVE